MQQEAKLLIKETENILSQEPSVADLCFGEHGEYDFSCLSMLHVNFAVNIH